MLGGERVRLDLRFAGGWPNDMRVWIADEEVVGIQFRLSAARAFANGRNQSLRFEPEPHNKFDPNAIKVLGLFTWWFFKRRVHLGYVSAFVAQLVAERGGCQQLAPCLTNIWWGGYVRDFIVIRFHIVEPRPPRSRKGKH
jgi:hypothetical protein